MEDSTRTVRPHKPYAKHGRAAQRARKSVKSPENIETPPAPSNGSQSRNTVLSPIKDSKLKATAGIEKIRIVRLMLAGSDPQLIASKCGIELRLCKRIIKEIDEDMSKLTWNDYLSVLLGKLQLLLDNHSQIGQDLQMALFRLDDQVIVLEAEYDTIKAKKDRDPNDLIALTKQLAALRKERIGLLTELNANNTALTTNLSKMGVTNVPTTTKIKVPTQSSTDGEIPRLEELPPSYTDMGKDELLRALRDSNKDVGRYLRAETARKKELERESE